MNNYWAGHFTADLPAANNKHRLKQLKRFMGVKSLEGRHALDIGKANYISREMKIAHNTFGDLNKGVKAPDEDYEIVTCLETLQHTLNHETVLRGINSLMRPGGKLFISTPKPFIFVFPHGKGNYVEIYPHSFRNIIEYCGFKIIREKTMIPWPFRFVFYGFLQPLRWFTRKEGDGLGHPGAPPVKWYWFGLRPIARYLLNRYIIIEAEKI